MTGRQTSSAHDLAAAAEARAVLAAGDPAPVAEVLGAVHRALVAVVADDHLDHSSGSAPAEANRLAVRRRADR